MNRYDRRCQIFAIGLAAVAGYVDAIGFLKLGGFFVSFMSGNSTRLAVGVISGVPSVATALTLIGCFIVGVMLGTFVGHIVTGRRTIYVLATVSVLLAGAALLSNLGFAALSIFAMTLAMGAENTVFAEGGDVQIGVTYMTGTLVKLGQRLALALLHRKRSGWTWTPFLFLWLGLVLGAVAGAAAYLHMGMNGLWVAAVAVGGFAIAAWHFEISTAR
jgi:uncharacterized membrane protein YoaK (UPF0700 family)